MKSERVNASVNRQAILTGTFISARKRFFVFIILILIMTSIILSRLFWLQIISGNEYKGKLDKQVQENFLLHIPRGTIYDCNGRELAISVLTKSLYAEPSMLNMDTGELAELLAPILVENQVNLKDKLTIKGKFVWLKRMLDEDAAVAVDNLIKKYNLRGLGFIEESKRYYPNNKLAANVLGFVGSDGTGLSGVEVTLDKIIKNNDFMIIADTDNHGRPIDKYGRPIDKSALIPEPWTGKGVYLTINSSIQLLIEKSLDNVMTKTNARAATIILMDPQTGEIQAMANRPTFNPNEFYRYNQQEWRNRAVSFIYEPGVSFTTIVAAAALENNLITPKEFFTDNGYVDLASMRLGAAGLDSYVRSFGFGKLTEIELPEEECGLLFNPNQMNYSDLEMISNGQGVAVTPIQFLTAMAVIANGGMLVKPHIVKEIINKDGSLTEATSTQIVRRVISLNTANILASKLAKVVNERNGKTAKVNGYHFAGNIDTVEKRKNSANEYEAGNYIVSFVAFGPVEDPKVVALIVLDNPDVAYPVGDVADPILDEILPYVLLQYRILPTGGNL